MKAFIIDRYGKKEVGHISEMPAPEVRDDDVLIQVHAASVNPLDSKIKSGEFKLILPYRLPLVMGNDVAGKVVRVGAAFATSSRVTRFMRVRMMTASAPLPSLLPSRRRQLQ